MDSTLAAAFTRRKADPDTIHQCLRYYLSERLDDLTTEEMHSELITACGSRADDALNEVAEDPLLLENAALLVLSSAWTEAGQPDRILQAAEGAKAKLPVIDVGIIAVVIMYGLYLLRTGGIKRSQRTTIRHKDGSLTETVITEYADPLGPLSALTKFFDRAIPPATISAGRRESATEPQLPEGEQR
jgi:hypothetical protein